MRAHLMYETLIQIMLQISVMISVVANLIVVLVLWARRKRLKATHWFVVALALSDICFSLLLHPMLVATSFGSDADELFTKTGRVNLESFDFYILQRLIIQRLFKITARSQSIPLFDGIFSFLIRPG